MHGAPSDVDVISLTIVAMRSCCARHELARAYSRDHLDLVGSEGITLELITILMCLCICWQPVSF